MILKRFRFECQPFPDFEIHSEQIFRLQIRATNHDGILFITEKSIDRRYFENKSLVDFIFDDLKRAFMDGFYKEQK